MADYDVYGVGNALVDIEFEVSEAQLAQLCVDKGLMTLIEEDRHLALLDGLSDHTGKRCSGGSAANTIIACAQLGGKTFYSCKVASDETGDFYMSDMNACGVTTNLTKDGRDGGVTGKCIVLVTPDAERSMSTFLGITQKISQAEMDENAIRQSQFAYIEGYLVPEPNARAAAIKTREIAQAAGVKTALTLSDINMVKFFGDGLREIIGERVDMLFANEDEAKVMFDADSMEACVEGMKSVSKQFAITQGGQGATVFDGNTLTHVPAAKVTAIDTNGAGDMYAGSFLYGLTHGMPFERCAELAGTAATQLITQFGARLPTNTLQKIAKEFSI